MRKILAAIMCSFFLFFSACVSSPDYAADSPKVLVHPTIKTWLKPGGATEEEVAEALAACREEKRNDPNWGARTSSERSRASLDCMLRHGFHHRNREYE